MQIGKVASRSPAHETRKPLEAFVPEFEVLAPRLKVSCQGLKIPTRV
jgi:hypothetical protein